MRELLHSVALRAARYLEDIQERRVSPSAEAVRDVERFHEPLPDGPTAPEDVIRMLDEVGSPATMGIAGPRFFGFVIGGSLPAALGANWLASAWDQNAGLFAATPISATLEEVSLRWLLDALALPAGCGGAFVTGATVANFTALAAARHAVLARVGWDVEAQGLFGAPAIQVVVSEEAHPSVIKSLGMLGMGRERVVRVPVDGQGRMLAGALPELNGPSIVCVQVGNVNTGSFDPVSEICRRAHEGAPGCTWTERSGCGPPPVRAMRIWWREPPTRIRGPPTPTSGSTFLMTAASRSCATRTTCAARWA